MRTGRPIPPLTLAVDERETLENWMRRPTTAQALAQRSRLIMVCSDGKANGIRGRGIGALPADSWQMAPAFLDGSAEWRLMNGVRARREDR